MSVDIEEIKRRLDWMFQNVANEDAYLMGDALVVINQQQAEIEKLKNQWISVDDRLPKKHDYYLVCHKHDNDSKTNIDKLIYSYSHGGWISTYGAKYSGIVTHWMPLPEPPEVK